MKMYAELSIFPESDYYFLKIDEKNKFANIKSCSVKEMFGKEILYDYEDMFIVVMRYIFNFEDEDDLRLTLFKLANYLKIDIDKIDGADFLFNEPEWKI